MEPKQKSLGERLNYVFSPGDAKGVGFFDRLILTLFGANDAWVARSDNPQEKMLIDMTAALAKKMNIATPPEVLVYHSDKPNAASLVTGRIVIGTNLMEILTPGQMEAVIGHELAHHRHRPRDWAIRLGGFGAVVAGLMAVSKQDKRKVPFIKEGGFKEKVWRWFKGEPVNAHISSPKVLAEEAGVLVAGQLLSKAYQRKLEYESDREGAIYTGRAEDMIGALQNLEKRVDEIKLERLKRQYPELIFPENVKPPEREPGFMKQVKTYIGHLFHDHPPFDKRYERLEKIQAEQQAAASNIATR